MHTDASRFLHRRKYIRRIARARKHDQDVARLRQHGELQRKDLVVALVIGKARNGRRISRQRMHPHARSRASWIAHREIVGKVNGVAAAAAVARKKDLAAGLPAIATARRRDATTGAQLKPCEQSAQDGASSRRNERRRPDDARGSLHHSLCIHLQVIPAFLVLADAPCRVKTDEFPDRVFDGLLRPEAGRRAACRN